jgi:tetratricopeptide (TPR) repeat protein
VKTALLLFSLFALSPQDPKTLTLTTNDGETVMAQVLEVKGDSAKLKVSILGGNMTVTRKLADFAPLSVLRIEIEAKNPTDFDSHFAMAQRAAELGLLQQAGSELRAAVETVKDATEREAKTKQVRTWAADVLETMTKQAVAEGRLTDARHSLKLLSTRMADQRTEEQLDALAGEVQALAERIESERDKARQAKLDAQALAKVAKTLGEVSNNIAKGDKLSREAISKSRSTVQSANLCEKAIDAYKAGGKKLKEVLDQAAEDPELAKEAGELSQRLHDNGIRAALHAANVLTIQSDYKGAMDWANRVIAFDPSNAEAKEMVKTIQVAAAAASSDWGWQWSIVGGRPAYDPRRK